jgi:hypothetical protein
LYLSNKLPLLSPFRAGDQMVGLKPPVALGLFIFSHFVAIIIKERTSVIILLTDTNQTCGDN